MFLKIYIVSFHPELKIKQNLDKKPQGQSTNDLEGKNTGAI